MPHFQGQHDKPAQLSDEQFAELKALIKPIHDMVQELWAAYDAHKQAALPESSDQSGSGPVV